MLPKILGKSNFCTHKKKPRLDSRSFGHIHVSFTFKPQVLTQLQAPVDKKIPVAQCKHFSIICSSAKPCFSQMLATNGR